ncbi:MAG TPA: glycoside hydrolase family 15 protein [Acidimicrobiia bacterium]|nr:glycoside hydrolase family 15 protein [Acidimicrobiia bacterium]
MSQRIEDYALIGDTRTAALVGRDGSIDWLCLPRFDSGAVFAALLGDRANGRWIITPEAEVRRTRRAYRPGTLVLDTEFDTVDGDVRVTDVMPTRGEYPSVVRIVTGLRGTVRMRMQLVMRFDYGSITPWVRNVDGCLRGVAGPDALVLRTDVPTHGEDEDGERTTVASFNVRAGDDVPFVLQYCPSFLTCDDVIDGLGAVASTEEWWREWSARSTYDGDWREDVQRSVVTLKALTYAPTGGIVAAPTTSLPECLGGVRNWDYRYCWLRDATFTLYALMIAGYLDEATAWRDWLLRTVAGDPADLQIMYGPAGERRLPELELDWLGGYEGSKPVRIGNAASGQYQIDVYGEMMDALHQTRRHGIDPTADAWDLERVLMDFLESGWKKPDDGIWEVRGPRRHFTHSKVMAWVAFDRAVHAVERFHLDGPVDRWRSVRDEIHREVCEKGYDAQRGAFVQYYGSKDLDASLLMIPLVGFLSPSDERVVSTVDAIQRELVHDGFVARYETSDTGEVDGLPQGEGAFLPCSFWLADNLAMMGRRRDALALFERLRGLQNDVGLFAEEYDASAKRLVGNFPQAFTHVSFVNSACNLSGSGERGPAHHRARHHNGG